VLLDDAATRDAIHRLVTTDLETLDRADSLIVFFAGHGHTTSHALPDDRSATTGYLILVDGGPVSDSRHSWIRLDVLLSDIALLPPRHILVIVDACSSGIALQSVSSLVQLRKAATRALRDRGSRRIITSALDDQSARTMVPSPAIRCSPAA
jgi:uncharacterized caspase-like protein